MAAAKAKNWAFEMAKAVVEIMANSSNVNNFLNVLTATPEGNSLTMQAKITKYHFGDSQYALSNQIGNKSTEPFLVQPGVMDWEISW